MVPEIGHIQITVRDMESAERFYDRMMPLLGFDLARKVRGYVKDHDFRVVEYVHDGVAIGINSPRESLKDDTVHRRRPGSLHHLAFKARSRHEVDEVFGELKEIGAQIVEAPRVFPQHGQDYYACFFKDLDGVKYEVVFEPRE